MADVVIINYGMGNVRSVKNAVEYCGFNAAITADPLKIADASHVILPGVGAFGEAMANLKSSGLVEILEEKVRAKGKPMLGICLGMQVLAHSSTEHSEHGNSHRGLGWFEAEVVRIDPKDGALKIPHMGWNNLTKVRDHPVLTKLKDRDLNFYFVHSYQMRCRDKTDVVALTQYGVPVTAIIARGNVVATQFHPEKSQDSGIELLGGFLAWNP